jgi:hypothetical protein
VEHEREPLGGVQRLEDHEQREADEVGQERLVLRVGRVDAVDDRLGHAHLQRNLSARSARAQHVQRHAPDDGRQPSAEVLDLACVGAAESQLGLLDGVVGLAHGAEHPIGHRAQAASLLLEELRQPVSLIHRSRSSVVSGHGTR